MVKRIRRGVGIGDKQFSATERSDIQIDPRNEEEIRLIAPKMRELLRMPADDLDLLLAILEDTAVKALSQKGLKFEEMGVTSDQVPTLLSFRDLSSYIKIQGHEHDSDEGYAAQFLFRIRAVRQAISENKISSAARAAFDLGSVVTEMRMKSDADIGRQQSRAGELHAEERNRGLPERNRQIWNEYKVAVANRQRGELLKAIKGRLCTKFKIGLKTLEGILKKEGDSEVDAPSKALKGG